MNQPPPATVLVYVGLDLVGDGVMKLPFLASVRRCFPAARVTWLAGEGKTVYADSLAPLVEGLIDEVIEEAGVGGSAWQLLRRPLAGRRFDLILDTQRRVLTSCIVKRIAHRRFISAAAGWRLSDATPPDGPAKRASMIGQMLSLLDAATGRRVPPSPLPALDPAWLTTARQRLPDQGRYVGLAPGAGGRHKCWPLERFIALAGDLAGAGWQPVLLLGPAERDWEEQIRAALPTALLPLTDQDPLPLTIALATRLQAAVANDSGTGHLLAAAGIPLLSLFGPTAPEKFAPATVRLTIITAQQHGGSAMDAIPLAAVREALLELLPASAS